VEDAGAAIALPEDAAKLAFPHGAWEGATVKLRNCSRKTATPCQGTVERLLC
jgi:hypothetical protein